MDPSWERLLEGRKTDCLPQIGPITSTLVFLSWTNTDLSICCLFELIPKEDCLPATTLQLTCGFSTTVRSKKLNEINGKVIHLLEIIASVMRLGQKTTEPFDEARLRGFRILRVHWITPLVALGRFLFLFSYAFFERHISSTSNVQTGWWVYSFLFGGIVVFNSGDTWTAAGIPII